MNDNSAAADALARDLPLSKRKFYLRIASLVIALALAALDSNIVNPALPRMAASLGGMDSLPWVVSAFLMCSTVTMPLYGKLSDIYGRSALFTVAIGIFVLGSLLCSLSANMTQLIGFRAVQGLGAGGLIPLVMTAIGDIVPARERGKYQGLFMAVFAASTIGGPVLGGVLTDGFGWRSIFWVNIPLGALALVVLRSTLPRSEVRPHALDYVGVVLVVAATIPLILSLSRATSLSGLNGTTYALFAAAIGGALALYFWEKRFPEPVVAVNLFSSQVYLRCIMVTTLIGLGYFGTIVFIPLFLQQARNISLSISGMMITPLLLGNVAASWFAGQFIAHSGRYKLALVVGLGIVSGGLFVLAYLLWNDASLWAIGSGLAAIGIGRGLSSPQVTLAAQNAVATRHLGAATSTLQFFNSLAASGGVAWSGAMLNVGVASAVTAKLGPAAAHELITNASVTPATQSILTVAYDVAIGRACILSASICGLAFIASVFIPNMALKEE